MGQHTRFPRFFRRTGTFRSTICTCASTVKWHLRFHSSLWRAAPTLPPTIFLSQSLLSSILIGSQAPLPYSLPGFLSQIFSKAYHICFPSPQHSFKAPFFLSIVTFFFLLPAHSAPNSSSPPPQNCFCIQIRQLLPHYLRTSWVEWRTSWEPRRDK